MNAVRSKLKETHPQRTLLLACGALAKDLVWLIEANGLEHLDLKCLPAQLHHSPARIPDAVRAALRKYRDKYQKILVVYGDCGTGGALDKVLEEEGGIERIPGPHCFSFIWGNAPFARYGEDEITTFFLTDFFCRHFETFMWEAYGLDRHRSMVDFVFGNYEKLVFLAQNDDAALKVKAKGIADRLGLSYEYRLVGFGDLEPAVLNA